MIFLFHGTDIEKVRTKAFAWVAAAKIKEPQLAYTRLAREELSPASLESASSSGGLFVKRLLVLIDDPFSSVHAKGTEEDEDTPEVGGVFEEYLDALAVSDNAIVVVAPKLAVAKVKKFSAKAAKVYVANTPERAAAARGFNSALVAALSARDAQKLWLEVVRSLRAGDAPEMLHGLLHWKARDLMQKPSRAWKQDEARALSMRLITLVVEGRRKSRNLSHELERFALSV